jgi:hypothetical protein
MVPTILLLLPELPLLYSVTVLILLKTHTLHKRLERSEALPPFGPHAPKGQVLQVAK